MHDFENVSYRQGFTFQRGLEIVAIGAVAVYAALLGVKIWNQLATPYAWTAVIVFAFFGYVGADLASGLAHWLADRYGTVNTPIFGPNFVRPFREHHVRPKDITLHDFIETNGSNCIVSVWILIGTYHFAAGEPGLNWGLFVNTMAWSLCLAVFATNQFHKWAHKEPEEVPAFVRWLQRHRIVLSKEHHDIHHHAPYETHYCITTGWLNGPLARIGFFARMERLAYKLFGIQAGVDDQRYTVGA